MKKRKVEWIAAVAVVLVIGTVLAFLLYSAFDPNAYEADITLPDSTDITEESEAGQRPTEPGDKLQQLSVTRQNVQDVIRTLTRPESYYLHIENVVSYGEESRVTNAEQWVLPDSTLTRVTDSLSPRALCTLIIDGETTIWYEGDDRVLTIGSGSFADTDQIAGVPSYRDILSLDPDIITAADLREWEDVPCIYVESYDDAMRYSTRYYVSIDCGLLLHAETYTQGELVYSMTLLEFSEDTTGVYDVKLPE